MSSSQLIGVFGGSFDPPHLGHLGIAENFWKNFPNAEELVVIPNFTSPWKQGKKASPEDVLALVQAQFHKLPKTRIWEWELQQGKSNYTDETLAELSKERPNSKLALLIGEDNYSGFHKWRNWETILDQIHLLLVFRRFSVSIPLNPELKEYQDKILFLDNPIVEAASVELRSNLTESIHKKEKPSVLSQEVWELILEKECYVTE
ncbi:nicotinate (nicotinamide) nucleotide adenylyltransferase [Leptospira langatensis]|uniref:Probable nicotinate-nucleotide adenylyltransferase n=1 Tax=Leptospira langatensis TaxID=2484983 RepID=A0A5F1ZVA1_9LEPT|nr:nicotinate (nicotinamide) nucleotide adenylyltransferase [Leptospira langatensis]TGK00188.1 nicotinate (nicotinamide) nucleotide adenylyltransferase [Leptospira langatensis]TGL41182.1 nicotinate (nicotinamide) nucleotide adenylyltransferase [Leptospira langatensis]